MNKNLKKAISAISALALTASSFVAVSANYTDVTADTSYASAINELSALGIVDGFEDGTFKPDENVNRAQFAKLVVGAMNKLAQAEANTTQIFTDVAPGSYDWAIGYVAQAYQDGLVEGTNDENTTYDPSMNVTYAQAMKMLVCAAGYEQWSKNAGGWPNGYLSYANQVGIGNGVTGVSNDTALTRGQCAQMIANTLMAAICKNDGFTVDNGVQVPNKKQMDGSDSKVFQSLLTQNWKAYEINGAVTGTHEMGTTEAGKVNYKIMRTKNYNDSEYGDNAKNSLPVTISNMYVGSTNASETLNQYTRAIVSIDDASDDVTIKYIELAGKNVEVQFDANNYSSLSSDKIAIYKSASSSSTTEYKLADGVTHGASIAKMLVNGVEMDLNSTNADRFLTNNANVKAVLIDTPANTTGTSVSTDGYYDYVVVDYALPAVVDEVTTKSSKQKVNFDTYATDLGKGYLDVDPDDDTKTYTFLKDGKEINVSDLQQNDVLSIKWNVNGNINESDFIKATVTNNVVSGNCTAQGKDSNGDQYYTVNNTKYYMSKALDGDKLNVSYTYDLYLDANGDIAKYVQNAASVNLAVVDRTFTSAGDDKVRLITKTGEKKDYTLKSGAGINDTIKAQSAGTAKSDTDWPLEERIVEYSVNSSDEVTIKGLADNIDRQSVSKYEKATGYVGSYKITDSSILLDASNFAKDGKDSVSVASTSSFADQMDYGIIVAGQRNSSDNTYPFIVIYQGDNGYTVDTQMAIYNSYGTAKDDGTDVYEMFAFIDGADEKSTIICDDSVEINGDSSSTKWNQLSEGDAVIYKKNSDNYVDEIFTVTSMSTNDIAANGGLNVLNKVNETATKYPYNTGSMISSSVNGLTFNGDGDVSFVFAPVIDKDSTSVTVALNLTAAEGKTYTSGLAGKTFSYASGVKAYSFDGGARENNKVEAIGASGVVKSSVVKAGKLKNETLINWESTDNTIAYALLRLVDNQVKEVLSITTADLD